MWADTKIEKRQRDTKKERREYTFIEKQQGRKFTSWKQDFKIRLDKKKWNRYLKWTIWRGNSYKRNTGRNESASCCKPDILQRETFKTAKHERTKMKNDPKVKKEFLNGKVLVKLTIEFSRTHIEVKEGSWRSLQINT